LLGRQQHGHIESIGFDLYVQMLEGAVASSKAKSPCRNYALPSASVWMSASAGIHPSENLRLRTYKRVSSIARRGEQDVRKELEDRFGAMPKSVENLLEFAMLKSISEKLRIASVERQGPRRAQVPPRTQLDPRRGQVVRSRKGIKLDPSGVLWMELQRGNRPGALRNVLLGLRGEGNSFNGENNEEDRFACRIAVALPSWRRTRRPTSAAGQSAAGAETAVAGGAQMAAPEPEQPKKPSRLREISQATKPALTAKESCRRDYRAREQRNYHSSELEKARSIAVEEASRNAAAGVPGATASRVEIARSLLAGFDRPVAARPTQQGHGRQRGRRRGQATRSGSHPEQAGKHGKAGSAVTKEGLNWDGLKNNIRNKLLTQEVIRREVARTSLSAATMQ